jgi:hypothetical protein
MNYFSDYNQFGIWSPDFSGDFKISGVMRRDDGVINVVRRKVDLYDSKSGKLLKTTYSSSETGAYIFDNLKYKEHGYRVVLYDYPPDSVDSLNAAVADFATPGRM